MMKEESIEWKIEQARMALYGHVIEFRLGVEVKIREKDYFFSGYTIGDDEEAPNEWRAYPFVLRDGRYNERPENRGKVVRAFKDEFDLMENFKIDGKCLRLLIEDGEVEYIDYDE